MSAEDNTEQQTPTGKEVEQELLKAAEQEVQQASPEEVASQLLYMYTPIFENLVNSLSSNAMRRLLKKLVQYPLNEKEMKASSAQEEQAFQIGNRLLESKFVLVMDVYAKNIEQMQKQADEQAKGE